MSNINLASETDLPPFGIRGLYSIKGPFAVLRLSELDYDDSLRSHPDSALTWVDEDDGEIVTVGSGRELREKLNEPVPASNPQVSFRDIPGADRDHDVSSSIENQYIHLFDISQSQTSLNVWRDHEAYFSKRQVMVDIADSPSGHNAPQEKEKEVSTIEASSQESTNINRKSEMKQTSDDNETASIVQSAPDSAVPELVGGLGRTLNHLAGFLQGTSNSLRKAAEKTREMDTTPIEDVITGMSAILGEVGAVGLDIFDKLNDSKASSSNATEFRGRASTIDSVVSEEDISGKPDNSTPIVVRSSAEFAVEKDSYADFTIFDDNQSSSAVNDQVSASIETHSSEQQDERGFRLAKEARGKLLDEELRLLHRLISLNRRDRAQTMLRKSGVNDGQLHQNDELVRAIQRKNLSKKLAHVRFELDNVDLINLRSLQSQNAKSSTSSNRRPLAEISVSIANQDLDVTSSQSTAQPIPFAIRMGKVLEDETPLTKQSKTIPYDDSCPQNTRISQPCPRVFDAETFRRREFAKTCYPAQEYTPGSEPTALALSPPKSSAWTTVAETDDVSDFDPADDQVSVSTYNTWSSIADAKEISIAHEVPIGSIPPSDNTTTKPFVVAPPSKALPGSWPDANTQEVLVGQDPFKSLYNAARNPFGNFKGTASEISPIESSEHDDPDDVRKLHRHRSLASPSIKSLADSGIHRSHTVSSTNPAARLNSPFSPFFPAPITSPPTTDTQLIQPKVTAGPVRHLHRSNSERRPRSLYEPYRSNNTQRGFEPVWEEHVQRHKVVDPNAGVVIVDASHFTPGISEQGIRDLLSAQCQAADGISPLVSCRIVDIEPIVVAKLIVKDKRCADRIIQAFNGKLVDGRRLKFEYCTSGIDARINHMRGVLPPKQVSLPKHQRSVPNLGSVPPSGPSFGIQSTQPAPRSSFDPVESKAEIERPLAPLPSNLNNPHLPTQSKRSLVDDCEQQLKAMGYGSTDPDLFSRVGIYAAATNGDIDEAIEMIEEDKKASTSGNFHRDIRRIREVRRGTVDSEDHHESDTADLELQQAIRLSLHET